MGKAAATGPVPTAEALFIGSIGCWRRFAGFARVQGASHAANIDRGQAFS